MLVLVPVCLFVYLFVCQCLCRLAYRKNHMCKRHQISLHVICGRGSILLWQQCSTSSFVDDVMCSNNTANGQSHKRLVCFVVFACWWHQLDVRQRYVWSISLAGGTGGEVGCLWLHLIGLAAGRASSLLKPTPIIPKWSFSGARPLLNVK